MLSAEIIYVGPEKEKDYAEAASEYIKRLGAFCSFSEKNVKDEKLPDGASESQVRQALEKEGERIVSLWKPKTYRIAMCVEGKQLSSTELASLLASLPEKGYSGVSFVIGSSEGLSDSVKKSADFRLSVSKMTFPHRLFRVMLLEQIYRAFSINAGRKYHK